MHPPASSTMPVPSSPRPTAAISPPLTATSARLVPLASTTVPPTSTRSGIDGGLLSGLGPPRVVAPLSQQHEQHGHADRHPVGHLPGDHRAGQVGDFGGDLHPPVHGPGVHDQGGG